MNASGGGQGMVGGAQNPNQGLVSQSTNSPALVAQLRQMPNQANMMSGGQQQYNNHPQF